MNTDTPDAGIGTPLENGAAAVSHTVGVHYTQATAADAGEAIALDASELAATAEPDYAVPGTHDIIDPESGCALAPDEAIAVAREENEGNSMVPPPRIPPPSIPPPQRPRQHPLASEVLRRVQAELQRDPEGPTGS
jgi:hypothetical protein